jgi:hypothetical protein
MTLTIIKPDSKKKGLSDCVRDLKTQTGGGYRKPPKSSHSAVATGESDDDKQKKIDDIKEGMESEDWKKWEEEFDDWEEG